MLVNTKNLEIALRSERSKFKSENDILDDVKAILLENEELRKVIKHELQTKSSTNQNDFVFDLIETDKIFHIQEIKNVCIDYRLRFLDSHFYKNEIPEEAISKIATLEKNHGTKLNGFKIIAPSKAFHLLNYDDPLLFAPIGNDYYYLIHKWGNDMSPVRKLMVKPVRNLSNFIIFSLILSVIITCFVPANNLSKSIPFAPFIIFLFMFKSVIAVFCYYFFMLGKNFNEEIWQNKYYNN
ncbi:hypothetical protein [Flavobacterium luteum]|uniref:Uncharacterized protein n=1 Tax=Flavobacterium luteum TaxID=2026654 RepID=A0A7J5AJB4_9FLAO|nr:hypothetical protein [Flavobacterium luteum]KAB1157697.1 hypothetical protein F6464_01030 [Flavobacterium luteum]